MGWLGMFKDSELEELERAITRIVELRPQWTLETYSDHKDLAYATIKGNSNNAYYFSLSKDTNYRLEQSIISSGLSPRKRSTASIVIRDHQHDTIIYQKTFNLRGNSSCYHCLVKFIDQIAKPLNEKREREWKAIEDKMKLEEEAQKRAREKMEQERKDKFWNG
jgi:hypothetical protein